MRKFVLLVVLSLFLFGCTEEATMEDKVANESPKLLGFEFLKTTYNLGDPLPDFLAGIQAIDQEDRLLNHAIRVDTSDVNMNVAGKYSVVYTVEDSASNKSTHTIEIEVKDLEAPMVYGFSDLSIPVNHPTKPDYLKGIKIQDQASISVDQIVVDDSRVKYDQPGDYEVIYQISDPSGNMTEFSITVTVLNEDESNVKPPKTYYPVEFKSENTVILTIGFGYNYAKYPYASMSNTLTSEILDWDWLASIQLIQTNIAQKSKPTVFTASSYERLIEQLDSPSQYEILNHIELEYNLNDDYYNNLFLYLLNMNEYRFMLSMPDEAIEVFHEHLDPIFIKNLEKLRNNEDDMNYERFFDIYGTHIITKGIYGGNTQIFCVNRNWNDLINPSTCTMYTDAIEQRKDIPLFTNPNYMFSGRKIINKGGSALGLSFSQYDEWVKSLEGQETIISFTDDGIIPIWDILPEKYHDLKEQMKIEYEKYRNNMQNR